MNELAEFFSSLIVQLIGNVLLVVGYLISDRLSKIATTRWEADREQSAQVWPRSSAGSTPRSGSAESASPVGRCSALPPLGCSPDRRR